MQNIEKQKYYIVMAIAFVFVFFWLINHWTPRYLGDDYIYRFVWENGHSFHQAIPDDIPHLSSLSDVLYSVKNHYSSWHGRLMPVFLMFFFGWQDKWLFDIFNSVVFVLFILLLCVYCSRGKWNISAKQYLLMAFFVWWFMPGFVNFFLWICGSVNYLWTTVLVLLFALPYVREWFETPLIKNNIVSMLGMSVVGFFVGCTNEIHMPAFILCLIVFLWYRHKRGGCPTWAYAGVITTIVGFIVMMISTVCSPRAAVEVMEYFAVIHLTERPLLDAVAVADDAMVGLQQGRIIPWLSWKSVSLNAYAMSNMLAPPLVLLALSTMLHFVFKPKISLDPKDKIFFITIGLLALGTFIPLFFVMFVVPRMAFHTMTYMFILSMMIVCHTNKEDAMASILQKVCTYFIMSVFLFTGYWNIKAAHENYTKFLQFDTYMRSHKGQSVEYTFYDKRHRWAFKEYKFWDYGGLKKESDGRYRILDKYLVFCVKREYQLKDLVFYVVGNRNKGNKNS